MKVTTGTSSDKRTVLWLHDFMLFVSCKLHIYHLNYKTYFHKAISSNTLLSSIIFILIYCNLASSCLYRFTAICFIMLVPLYRYLLHYAYSAMPLFVSLCLFCFTAICLIMLVLLYTYLSDYACAALPLFRVNVVPLFRYFSIFRSMLKLGRSRPWPEAMKIMTGQRAILLDSQRNYFEPLREWMVKHRKEKGYPIGWWLWKNYYRLSINVRSNMWICMLFSIQKTLSTGTVELLFL